MPRFRSRHSFPGSALLFTLDRLGAVIADTIRPAHFFLGPRLNLEWEHVAAEELVWEIFRGQLLDPAHTRQRRTFGAWKIYAQTWEEVRSGEPLIALYLDEETRELHVVRALDCYVWEGYDSGGNVYLSRESRKWVRERVGTIRLDRFLDNDERELADEIACLLFMAVVGTSRLPLSSLETPLPSFSFGQLFYCYRPDAPTGAGATHGWRGLINDMLTSDLHPREEAHLLETLLHAVPSDEMSEAAATFVHRGSAYGRSVADLPPLLRTMFNEVSLSPYTDLLAKTLAFLRALERQSQLTLEDSVDFLSYLLRYIGRHLTAYDLVVFHHRGANYPDALLLDAVLSEYRAYLRHQPNFFLDESLDDERTRRRKRIRRRALRQAWLLRRRYEGHAVPDMPTSPGENRRVLPASHPRVPEEQIVQPARRVRLLYEGDPLVLHDPVERQTLQQSFLDLDCEEEWREMGLGIFLDRPFGVGKNVGEPDATLLLSAEAFSASVARQRLLSLTQEIGVGPEDEIIQRLRHRPCVSGLPLDAIGEANRPGVISLMDARLAAADFVFLRNTPSSAKALLEQFDFTPLSSRFHLQDVFDSKHFLLARAPTSDGLKLYDRRLRPRMELEVVWENGFEYRGGQEYPLGGLRVVQVAEATADGETLLTHDLRDQPMSLFARWT
jgi:hypothetical protein